MPKYVIERQLPNASKLSAAQLQEISRKSCNVIKALGPDIQWQHSYVTGDKLFCVYIAANEGLLREHAQRGGFPLNAVHSVSGIIDPATAGV